MINNKPLTLYEKLLNEHVIGETDGDLVLYIDRHLIHEVTSPQAFSGLALKSRAVFSPQKTIATMDHGVSTRSLALDAAGDESYLQLQTLLKNCEDNGIRLYPVGHDKQGIVHVMAPELGLILPGMTVVCGDSHTSTHGAFGALAFGIGSSEVEQVLATQCLRVSKQKSMLITLNGERPKGLSAKDITLALIGKIGTAGATGHVIEYAGQVVSEMTMEERMTLCNMSIEAGARAGIVAPDATTLNYLMDKEFSPQNQAWLEAIKSWQALRSDEGAEFDSLLTIDINELSPQVTWGTNPGMVTGIDSVVPDPKQYREPSLVNEAEQALSYMNLTPGTAINEITIDAVFIGSCTNSRIEDLRAAAHYIKGKKVHPKVRAIVVPGSNKVKQQAETEGLDIQFKNAGFEWRLPGCSLCLGMNDDALQAGQRCASTSNRNFEGRQGRGVLTHLVSPAMAASAAIAGKFTDIRES
jgi:3-isopropylmalate/(R)-2-methylmalate dehydratase large subunit